MDGFNSFLVVINDDRSYSIWPEELTLPKGWKEVGFRGNKEVCLQYIKDVWTDLSPQNALGKEGI